MGCKTFEFDGFRDERALIWPGYDKRCAAVTFDECAATLDMIGALPGPRRVVIQAGGNCGQLVQPLAGLYEVVYTFEPDPMNFVALTVNTYDLRNVFRYQAALGNASQREHRGLAHGDDRYPNENCGAMYMSGEGKIPTLTVDMLSPPVCDLLYLDVEGSELAAIQGANHTIETCRPHIVMEQKALGKKFYGQAPDAALIWTIQKGYEIRERIGRDYVLSPKEGR